MRKTTLTVCIPLILCISATVFAQAGPVRHFPDIEGYKTLLCDFHVHTVFSDGLVWPTVRIDEAWREGLDGLALTDHIEHQPHKEDIPTKHQRPFDIAKARARAMNVLLIRGAEITRETPPGHYNAVFVDDMDLLETDKFLDVIEQANRQGGFVFWNHHAWQGLERGQWQDIQTQMRAKNWLHGIEVVNGPTYYPYAHKWCLEKNLTMVGNSDIHGPSVDYEYTARKHRTLTLVFAAKRSVAGIKEALFAGRTVVWYQNQLIGRSKYIEPLFRASVDVAPPHYQARGKIRFVVTNQALIDLEIERLDSQAPAQFTIPARSRVIVEAKAKPEGPVLFPFRVKNLLVTPGQGMSCKWEIPQHAGTRGRGR